MNDENEALRQRIRTLEHQVARLRRSAGRQCVRRRSTRVIWGLPLWDIACGPDPDKGEVRGHARGIFALGDIATGVFALGGIARGVVALGGLALGVLAFGGGSFGLLLAAGGLAVGGIATGGAAVGGIAIGGAAIGIVAIGGGVISLYGLIPVGMALASASSLGRSQADPADQADPTDQTDRQRS